MARLAKSTLRLLLFIYTVIAFIVYAELVYFKERGVLVNPLMDDSLYIGLFVGGYLLIGSHALEVLNQGNICYYTQKPVEITPIISPEARLKECRVLFVCLLLVCSVYGASVYQVIKPPQVSTTFTVWDVWTVQHQEHRKTTVLTIGSGKYEFIGNLKTVFQVGETYTVTYTVGYGGKHKYNNLKIIEVTKTS